MVIPSLRLVLHADGEIVIIVSMDMRTLTHSGWNNVLFGFKLPQMAYVCNRVRNFYSMAVFDGKQSVHGLLRHCEVCARCSCCSSPRRPCLALFAACPGRKEMLPPCSPRQVPCPLCKTRGALAPCFAWNFRSVWALHCTLLTSVSSRGLGFSERPPVPAEPAGSRIL